MRNLLILFLLLLMSCAEMHEPILHGGGTIRFIPYICYDEIDSIIIQRMSNYFEFNWEKEIFYKNLNDFHVKWYNNINSYDIDFIDRSEDIKTSYGEYDIIWNTNGYCNNILGNNIISTDHLADSICKLPDFVYSKKNKIYVSNSIHDYVQDEGKYIQIFEEKLLQRSFLYIVQVKLKNNNNRVKTSGAFSISGLAEKLNLYNEINFGKTNYVFNTQLRGDIIVGSFISFGLPNYNPYELRYEFRNGLINNYTNKNILYIQLVYEKGRKIVEVDVSDQMILQPTGGLIIIELNIDDHPESQTEMSDPFDVFISDYENVDQYYNNF